MKSVNLRLSLGESSGYGSVCVFRVIPGVTWGDRCWPAGMLVVCRAGWGAAAAAPGPAVPGPVPES